MPVSRPGCKGGTLLPEPLCHGKCVSCGLRHHRLPLAVAERNSLQKVSVSLSVPPCISVALRKGAVRVSECTNPALSIWIHMWPARSKPFWNPLPSPSTGSGMPPPLFLTDSLLQPSSSTACSPSSSRQEFPTQLVCHLCLVCWSDSWHVQGRASSGKAS